MLLSDHLPKNILVIDLRYIGDCLFIMPFLRNLKANFPNARVSALVNEGGDPLLRLLPEVSEVIVVKRKEIKGKWGVFKFMQLLKDIRKRKFDTVIVVPQSDRPTIIAYASGAKIRIGFLSKSWWRNSLLTLRLKYDHEKNFHLIEHHLQILADLGLKIFNEELSLLIPDEHIRAITSKYPLLKEKNKRSIIIHPGARGHLRQWGEDNFAEVINAFSEEYRIFLIGGQSEKDIIRQVQDKLIRPPDIVATELNLIEFASLCTLSDLFIGNDSAPIHIAAATGMFVIGLYGPTLPMFCRPWTEKSLLFDISKLQCRQCEQEICLAPKEKACIDEIKPEQVIEGVKGVLNRMQYS